MRRHGVNRNFTKPEAIKPLVFSPSLFERVVKALNISPEEYQSSPELKEWVPEIRTTSTCQRVCWKPSDSE